MGFMSLERGESMAKGERLGGSGTKKVGASRATSWHKSQDQRDPGIKCSRIMTATQPKKGSPLCFRRVRHIKDGVLMWPASGLPKKVGVHQTGPPARITG